MNLFSDPRLYTPDFLEADWTTRLLRPELEALADRANATPEERTRLDIVLSKIEGTGPDLREYVEEEAKESVEYATEDLQNRLEDAQRALEISERQRKNAEAEAVDYTIASLPKRWSMVDLASLPDSLQAKVRKVAAEHRKYPTHPRFIVTNTQRDKISVFSLGDLIELSDSFDWDTPEADRLWIVRGYKN